MKTKFNLLYEEIMNNLSDKSDLDLILFQVNQLNNINQIFDFLDKLNLSKSECEELIKLSIQELYDDTEENPIIQYFNERFAEKDYDENKCSECNVTLIDNECPSCGKIY